jgi:hypothetical protein
MALTDVYYSPSGAGSQDGSSAANAKAAVTGTSWTTTLEGETRQNTRWIFLAGTYTVNDTLTPTTTDPDASNPHFWEGADANGNLLQPKWSDASQAHLDTTDYPKIVQQGNKVTYDSSQHTYFKCLSFENTSSSFSTAVINNVFSEIIRTFYYGVFIKFGDNSSASNNNAIGLNAVSSQAVMCEVVAGGTKYSAVISVGGSNNASVIECRMYGPGTSGSGNGQGLRNSSGTLNQVINCVIDNVHGDGITDVTTTGKNNYINNTITRCGGNGINSSGGIQSGGPVTVDSNIIYDVGGFAIAANAGDNDAVVGTQIGIGDASSGNFSNLDLYENTFNVTAVSTADFVDYANQDYRIRRDSALYKFNNGKNLGAIQNEDFEFVSVS